MVLIPCKQQLAVQPDLPAVLAADADLRRAVFRAEKIRRRIAHHALLHAKGLVEVDLAILVRARELHPLRLLGLAFIDRIKLQLLLRRIHRVKAIAVRIAERRNHLPVHQKSKMLRQVHLLVQCAQLLRQHIDLVLIPRSAQALSISHNRRCVVLLLQRRISRCDQLRHRMPSQVRARVLQQRRRQLLRQFLVCPVDQIKRHHPCSGAVLRVLQKRHQRRHRQLLRLQRLIRDHAHRRPQPVFRQRIRPVHALQHLRQSGRIRLHDLLPRLRRRLISLAFLSHSPQRFDGFRQFLRRLQRHSGEGKQTKGAQFHRADWQAFTKNAPRQA